MSFFSVDRTYDTSNIKDFTLIFDIIIFLNEYVSLSDQQRLISIRKIMKTSFSVCILTVVIKILLIKQAHICYVGKQVKKEF